MSHHKCGLFCKPLFFVTIAVLLLSLAACQDSVNEAVSEAINNEKPAYAFQNDNDITSTETSENQTSGLDRNGLFTFEPVKKLKAEQPESGWVELKHVAFEAGNQKIIVRLFGNSALNNGEIKAFLEYGEKVMGLGIVSSYGIDQADVKMIDMNNDNTEELVITGTTGATASVTKIIGYSSDMNIWEEWLDTGHTYLTDIDSDGKLDIVSTSQGSLPPYTWIYRWNGKGYERLDAAEATGNDYAIFRDLGTGCWIEAGKTEAGKDAESKYYAYKAGMLLEHSKTFVERGEYIIPDSDKELLAEEDIEELYKGYLDLARNEIFARHGYVFVNEDYRIYFNSKFWYKENTNYDESLLSSIERQNADLLAQQAKRISSCFKNIESNTATIDLNRDGIKDRIRLECEPGDDSYTLTINGLSVTGGGNNLDGMMFVCDIDSRDDYKEIAITESGPSSDDATYFYYYDGSSINFMGRTQGSHYVLKITGSGVFTTKTRGAILQTWFYTDHYRLSSSHELEIVPRELYKMNSQVIVKKQLKLQKSRTDQETAVVLEPDEEVTLTACDNKEWCEVKNAKGIKGWFAVDDYYTMRGTDFNASDYFEGLSFAD